MSCIFPGCENTRHFRKNTGITFFNCCNLTESNLPKAPLVCSLHFGREDIVEGNVRKLNKNASPANKR